MKPSSRFMVCSLALAGLVIASDALAENLPREHDGGFFLRLSAGVGTAKTKVENIDILADGNPQDLEFSGTSGDVNFAIGAVVAPNLAEQSRVLVKDTKQHHHQRQLYGRKAGRVSLPGNPSSGEHTCY